MMKKGECEFINKFHLLSSQENSEEIIWSSSDSSDYGNLSLYNGRRSNQKQKIVSRKRKRKDTNKSLLNISNLDISYSNQSTKQESENINKSPVLNIKSTTPHLSLIPNKTETLTNLKNNNNQSPILVVQKVLKEENQRTSPILISKTISHSPKVRKKLFDDNNEKLDLRISENPSNVLKLNKQRNSNKKLCNEKIECNNVIPTSNRKVLKKEQENNSNNLDVVPVSNRKVFKKEQERNSKNLDMVPVSNRKVLKKEQENNCINSEVEDKISDKMKVQLLKKVQSYFDEQITPETSSLNSISEFESTPQEQSKASDEIDNIVSLTDENDKCASETIETNVNFDADVKKKRIRYKKDGLAYRLNSLIIKQNTNISLWQHERFLAENSKFVIPKEEFTAFRIKQVHINYGCHFIDAKDANNDNYNIIINNIHLNNTIIMADNIIKLYKPYSCFSTNNSKIIVNVTKYESVKLNK